MHINQTTGERMSLKKYRNFTIGSYNDGSGTQEISNLPSDFSPDNFYFMHVNDDYIYIGTSNSDDAEYSSLDGGKFIMKLGYEIDPSWIIELVYEPI